MIINNQYQIGILVTNKRIIDFMVRKLQFWTPVRYGQHTYILTFDNNVYRKD